jgi:DNA-binding IclR family transcriptional regulator
MPRESRPAQRSAKPGSTKPAGAARAGVAKTRDQRHTAGAQSINRSAAILRIVAAHGRAGASLKDVAAASGLHRATAHRILRALVDERLLEQDDTTRAFRLGLELYALGIRMGLQLDIKRLAQPSIERLWNATRETIYLGIRSGYDALCIDMREGMSEKRLKLYTEDLWPLGVGSIGMTLLAHLPDWEIAEIIAENAPRVKRLAAYASEKLLTRVAQTRQQGYAIDTTSGPGPGMCGLGVPIFDEHQRPIACLCVVGLASRLDERRRKPIVEQMWEEAGAISRLWSEARAEP